MSAGFSELSMFNLILSMIIGVPILCAMFGQGINKDVVTLMIELSFACIMLIVWVFVLVDSRCTDPPKKAISKSTSYKPISKPTIYYKPKRRLYTGLVRCGGCGALQCVSNQVSTEDAYTYISFTCKVCKDYRIERI